MVRVGTSGWSYPEWVGPFYPERTSPPRMLAFYAAHFGTVEAHSTHRRLPTAASLTRWCAQVGPEFRFAVKAHANITHRRDLDGLPERTSAFFRALEPLGDRLGPVLFVLPHRQPDLARLDALLTALPRAPAQVMAVFELAPAWRTPAVIDRLGSHHASLAVIDKEGEPEVTGSLPGPGPVAYVRLRRGHYSAEALAEWARRLAGAAAGGQEAYAFLKHDDHGDAPRYARALVERLDGG